MIFQSSEDEKRSEKTRLGVIRTIFTPFSSGFVLSVLISIDLGVCMWVRQNRSYNSCIFNLAPRINEFKVRAQIKLSSVYLGHSRASF